MKHELIKCCTVEFDSTLWLAACLGFKMKPFAELKHFSGILLVAAHPKCLTGSSLALYKCLESRLLQTCTPLLLSDGFAAVTLQVKTHYWCICLSDFYCHASGLDQNGCSSEQYVRETLRPFSKYSITNGKLSRIGHISLRSLG